jgi:hypothetical protein
LVQAYIVMLTCPPYNRKTPCGAAENGEYFSSASRVSSVYIVGVTAVIA